MNVEIRLYKRFDMDLVSLYDSGYSVANMIRDAVTAYANGSPIHYFIDEPVGFDVNDRSSAHTRFSVPDSDTKTCYMLKKIKHGYRNTFCKIILRNALVQQNLIGFFSDPSLAQLQNANMGDRNLYTLQNVIPCSAMKMKVKQSEILGTIIEAGKEKKEKPARKPRQKQQPAQNASYPNPFMNMGMPYPYMPYPVAGYPMTGNMGQMPSQQLQSPAPVQNIPIMPPQEQIPAAFNPNIQGSLSEQPASVSPAFSLFLLLSQ